MRSSTSSLVARSLLAILLTVGFYALALGVASALLYLIYLEFAVAKRVNSRLTIACLAGAATILWAVIPRPDRFIAPGLLLSPKGQPRLFQLIADVARAVGQREPAEVYLVPDFNAYVSERGGILGLGTRRVMGIGLPLMNHLDEAQLRAVIAHEFGHYHGGDTKLGPWIYRTREAIGRTIGSVGKDSLLRFPFKWYGMLFLRITQTISRNQEFQADRLAAQVAGPDVTRSMLNRIHKMGLAFSAYVENTWGPMAENGILAPYSQGYDLFLQSESVKNGLAATMEEVRKERAVDPYDSHPSLPERLTTLGDGSDTNEAAAGESAASLLGPWEAMEHPMLEAWLGTDRLRTLKPATWAETAQRLLPKLQAGLAQRKNLLDGAALKNVPALLTDPATIAKLRDGPDDSPPSEQVRESVIFTLGLASALALTRHGFTLERLPGQPLVVKRGETVFEPLKVIEHIEKDPAAAETWRAWCTDAGVADVPLTDALPSAPST